LETRKNKVFSVLEFNFKLQKESKVENNKMWCCVN